MFVSLVGSAVDIRPLRVHVPAFPDSSHQVCTVSLKAGLYTYNIVMPDSCVIAVPPLPQEAEESWSVRSRTA